MYGLKPDHVADQEEKEPREKPCQDDQLRVAPSA